MYKFASFLVCIAFIAASVHSAKADKVLPFIGDKASVESTMIGCREPDDTNQILKFLSEQDFDAIRAFILERPNACAAIEPTEIGMVDDISTFRGKICIRPKGQPHCFWYPNGFVVKK